jgi:hypothetical protein
VAVGKATAVAGCEKATCVPHSGSTWRIAGNSLVWRRTADGRHVGPAPSRISESMHMCA